MSAPRAAASSAWVAVRSVVVVALAALFTLFALGEGLSRAADDGYSTAIRVFCVVVAVAPVVGGAVTDAVARRRGRSRLVAVTAASWVALALANLALAALLVTTGRGH